MNQFIVKLYRQNEKLSRDLSRWMEQEPRPLQRALAKAKVGETLSIGGLQECEQWHDRIEILLREHCRQLTPEHTIPALIKSVNDCYYGSNRKTVNAFGQPLKVVVARIAQNALDPQAVPVSNSIAVIKNAISLAVLCHQLFALRIQLAAFGKPDDYVVFGPEIIRTKSQHMRDVGREFIKAYTPRGEAHRTLAASYKLFWGQATLNAVNGLRAVEKVLSGKSPSTQTEFRDTVFADIPATNVEFWQNVWVRVKLAIWAQDNNQTGNYDVMGFTILENLAYMVSLASGQNANTLYQALVWDNKWYQHRILESPDNMFVERPIVRISSGRDIYATSFAALGESLNWFVEASVMNYPNAGGVQLPSSIFQKYVSEPFEKEVNDVFKQHGYITGKVTQNGIWQTREKSIDLRLGTLTDCPGEIDALAYDPKSHRLFLGECKVLSYPLSINRTRNISLKLDPTDSEGFLRRIRAKLAWVQASGQFPPRCTCQGVLIIDRKLPIVDAKNPFPVLSIEELVDYIKPP